MDIWGPYRERLRRLGLWATDFEEHFAKAGGPGGQHVNKAATAVTLRHLPSGLWVTVQEGRSQTKNREIARERLLRLIENRQRQREAQRKAARERRRRQLRERPAALKKRILESKRKRSQKKDWRKRPPSE